MIEAFRTMTARIIDGKTIAADLRGKVADAVHRLRRDSGIVPGLAVVLVGEDPASQVYVRTSRRRWPPPACRPSIISCRRRRARPSCSKLIAQLNADPAVNGILVQLPLPRQIDTHKVIAAIDPAKDVDGFHPLNAGRLATGCRRWCRARRSAACCWPRPCTPRSPAWRRW